jgi:hypothetical protein
LFKERQGVEIMSWDDRYRLLREGEIVEVGDEILNDNGTWEAAFYSIGQAAPDPRYTSHRQFRRLKVTQTSAGGADGNSE